MYLLTGASGFLGRAIHSELRVDARVLTLGRGLGGDMVCDLAVEVPVLPDLDAVVHVAGKAHVYPRTLEEEAAFFSVNVQGTGNLFAGLEGRKIRKFVFISTVSVYGLESGQQIEEESELRGSTPYALSKIQAEQVVRAQCGLRGISWLILRLPLVAGHHAPGNLGKMVAAIQRGRYLRLARGEAQKSMVLAGDVAALIARWLADPGAPSGIYHLTDGHHPTFYELEEAICRYLRKPSPFAIPLWLGRLLGRCGDLLPGMPVNTASIHKIVKPFTFSDAKARRELGWSPRPVLTLYHEQ